ncbi:hypothetical protein HPB52_025344 [Rhipicephalus sanguineus]|uniref:CCHC-type domain-containing protein n=1 Tax=Rhipicephalus sanguineus TaxID=34632 RepID=A0A9D4YRI2_RHISA|nr:hypothetical protein HPB52_025344 [Rhipicephalus sanguineus]
MHFRISALKGLGVPPDQYTVVLSHILMRCLPEDLAIVYRQIEEERGDTPLKQERTRRPSFLKIQVEEREEEKKEAPSSHSRHSTMVPNDMGSPIRFAQNIPSASALAATESLQQRTLSCVLCNSRAHSPAECSANSSAQDKRARLRNARCFYRCGTRNHVARFCTFLEPHVRHVPMPIHKGPLRVVTCRCNTRFS